MIIRYASGRIIEAVTLARNESTMRVAVQGCPDVMLFNNVNGTWISEDCEPVSLGYNSSTAAQADGSAEEDFICSAELATQLRDLLFQGDVQMSA